MAFDNIRLPTDIEKGATGGPEFSTTIVDLSGGGESRNQDWSRARAVYSIGYGIDDIAQYKQLIAFFYGRRGRARGFRFKDWADYTMTDEPMSGAVNGTNKVFQLQKTYDDGAGNAYLRKISRPVSGTLVVKNNGVTVSSGAYSVALGVITFATAPTGGPLTATCEFDVPVRFDTDKMQRVSETATAVSFSSIGLREVIE